MAVRRSSVCLFCQARQPSIGRRKATTTARRRLEAVTSKPDDDGFLHTRQLATSRQRGGIHLENEMCGQQDGGSTAHSEALRQGMLEWESFNEKREERLRALRKLRNPWPDWNPNNDPLNGHRSRQSPEPPEAAAAPVPHHVFRQSLKQAEHSKAIRQILRTQLLRCEYPRDVLRIVAVAMNIRLVATNLSALAEPIIRALYRCRNNVSDADILRTIKIIALRFDMAGLRYARHLLYVGLKFAARARSLPAMQWFLRRVRDDGQGMSSNIFRSVIAKFSIGHRGLGEIRNGRWKKDELLQVLKGFEGTAHLPPHKQYHLGAFMVREDWQYLHGWVAVLARCRDADGVQREWGLWKKCPQRARPRWLNGQDRHMTTRLRGDYWFVEQMTYTGDFARAWALLQETGLRFLTLKPRTRSALLDGIEYMPSALWSEDIRQALLWKYDLELGKIEAALGMTWSAEGEEGGMHTLIPGQTQEEALERLAAEDFGIEDHYGFPYDEDVVVPDAIVEDRERALHDAKEEVPGRTHVGGGAWAGEKLARVRRGHWT